VIANVSDGVGPTHHDTGVGGTVGGGGGGGGPAGGVVGLQLEDLLLPIPLLDGVQTKKGGSSLTAREEMGET